jgi:nitrile hydratase
MILAMRDLLVEQGILTADQIRRGLETLDSWQPSRGAEIVARAWTDPAFKQRLLADGNDAVADFGIDMGGAKLTVLENTATVQNVVVCTLCSCYPRAVLGLPPDWYRSKNYRARVVKEPRKVLSEFGTELPDEMVVRVHDSLADLRYLVIPRRPAGTELWSRDELAAIITRDSMVGVTNPRAEPA